MKETIKKPTEDIMGAVPQC